MYANSNSNTPFTPLPEDAFQHSLGVHSGPPEDVTLEFDAGIADYVRTRQWHASQQWSDAADGRLQLDLRVCVDQALRSWILSFGPLARVVSPPALAREIAGQIEQARQQYADDDA